VRGSGGEGVTAEIRSFGELRRAVLSASRFASRILIERQAAGDVLRLLVLDDRVLDIVRRLRPRITGDGRSTIEQLVLAEYDRRLREDATPLVKPFVVDLDCILTLKAAGLSLGSVLPAGESVAVKTVTNYNRPEDNEALGTAVAEALREDAVRATRAVGLRLAGVDVVTRRPDVGLVRGGGVVVDVNAVPALHHHAQVAKGGAATRIAVAILCALLEPGDR
jgi:cyanophycin synthetase